MITPLTYLELQAKFQDRYELGIKQAGLSVWVLSSDVIFNYIYEAEIAILHELAQASQFELLRGYIKSLVPIVTSRPNGTYVTPKLEINYYVKSFSTIVSDYPGAYNYNGIMENTQITNSEALLYYTTATNKPYFKNPRIYINPVNTHLTGPGSSIEVNLVLIPDAYTTISRLEVNYIQIPSKPIRINQCYADWTMYDKIIDMSVGKAVAETVQLMGNKDKVEEPK